MKKRIVYISTTMIMLFLATMILVPGWSQEAKADNKNGYEYTETNHQITITKYTGTATTLDIGADFNNGEDSVTSIANNAFAECNTITSVKIPDSVTSIGYNVFAGCPNLQEATLSSGMNETGVCIFVNCKSLLKINNTDSIRTISNYSFSGCTSLKSVSFKNITTIDYDAFSECSELASIDIPATVTTIGASAFYRCSNLSEIVLPDGITTLNNNTFESCESLKSIKIPNSVTEISTYAFANCFELETINIPAGVTLIGDSAFSGCISLTAFTVSENPNFKAQDGVLFTIDMKTLLHYPAGSSALSYTVPESVTAIGDYAFEDASFSEIKFSPDKIESIGNYAFAYSNMNSFVMPNSVKTIGSNTFRGCDSLTNLTLSNQLTTIPGSMCRDCEKLSSIEIPSSITAIGGSAFAYCNALKTVTIPQNVKEMGSGVFKECINLTDATFNNQISAISSGMFRGCSKLGSVQLPSNITTIRNDSFQDCGALTNIDLPSTLQSIESRAFVNCISLSEITIPAATTQVADGTFQGCTDLTSIHVDPENPSLRDIDGVLFDFNTTKLICYPAGKVVEGDSYTVPATVNSLANAAFYRVDLKNIVLSDLITVIPYEAFSNCTELVSINLPSSLTTIYNEAFYKCTSLKEISNIPGTVNQINYDAFSYCDSLEGFQVDSSNFFKAEQGVLYTADGTALVCYPAGKKDSVFTIPSYVKMLNGYVFSNNSHLTEINIPVSELILDDNFFFELSALQKVNVEDGNVNYSSVDGVLFDKDKKTLICYPSGKKEQVYVIPDSVNIIQYNSFQNCSNITDVKIPASVTNIYSFAFFNCSNLKDVFVPNTVEDIEAYAFGFYGDISDNGAKQMFASQSDFKVAAKETNESFEKVPDFTMYCYEGSEAEEYAENFGVKYKILDHTIDTCDVQISDASVTYNGTQKTTKVTVKYGTDLLKEGEDYTVSYSNNVNVGKAKVTITGTGKTITGSIEKTFEIIPKAVDGLTVSNIANQAYTGTAITPNFTVQDGTKLLVKDTDYTVSYLANTEPGNAVIKITGKGNYAGSLSRPFIILEKPSTQPIAQPSSKSIIGMSAELSDTSFVYTGKAKKPDVILKDGTVELVEDTDYTVDYTNNKEVGTATATVTGMGKYSGTVKLTFSIKPCTPTIKVKAGTKKAKISWSKVKGASRYEIFMSKSKDGDYSLIKTVNSSTKSLVKKKLKSGKKYYFKVRAYRTVNGENIYGNNSVAKKCKVK